MSARPKGASSAPPSLTVTIILLAAFTGCAGTPHSVRALSAAQKKNTDAYCADILRTTSTLKEYFSRYEREKQETFDRRHRQNSNDQVELLRAQASKDSWDASKTAAEVTLGLNDLQTKLDADKAALHERVTSVASSLDTLTARCATLAKAQTKLDEYTQSQSTNDAVNQLLTDNLSADTSATDKGVGALVAKLPTL
jgi:hypothetical protein